MLWLNACIRVARVQEGVAVEIAEAVVGALQGELAGTAVNAPMVPQEVCFYCPACSLTMK